ncbi:MAG TPA: N-acyl homoserine lactonase family protein [Gammaproteobacteria bacterium]
MTLPMLTRRAALAFALLLSFAADGVAQAPAVVSPRLYVLEGGVLRSDPTRYRLRRSEVQAESLSVAAYLIVHPRGVLLWDAGAVPDDERISEEGGVEQRLVRKDGQERFVTLGPSLRSQLEAAGFEPEDVTHLALSHYHWDHTANANAFAHAIWLVRPEDREVMFANGGPGGARPETYAALRDSRMVEITEDEYDVFGDGKVIMKFAPGHTEGHQILYVDLERTGGVVLSGDLYHYPEERTLDRLPTFEVSEEQTAASRREIEEFLARKGATLWIQHDLTAHRLLKKAPEYYD